MDKQRILERIEQRLQKLDLSPSAASRAAGKPDAIRNLQRAVRNGGRQGLTTSTLAALAPVLKTSVGWLMDGQGDEDMAPERTVPVVGTVGAGASIKYRFSDGEIDRVPAPEDAGENTVAVQIDGESLGSFFDRWIVFYDDVHRPITPAMIGRLCVVGLPDERILIKKVIRSRTLPDHFTLLSQFEEPIYDVEIDWAALVTNMRPA